MKNKLLLPFKSLLLGLLFFLGSQMSVQAQMTVINNTECTIKVVVDQYSPGCSACNSSMITVMPPGGTWSHPYNSACGPEVWQVIKFQATGGVGVSFNPAFSGGCGPDVFTECDGLPLNVNWLSSGTGPAFVEISY